MTTSGQNESAETTSPPAMVTKDRNVVTLMLSLMKRTLPSPKSAVDAARVEREELVVGAAVAAGRGASRGVTGRLVRLAGTLEFVVRLARDAEAGVGLGPPPEPAKDGTTPGGAHAASVARGALGGVDLGVGAEVPLVAARVLAESDGIAGAVDGLGDPRRALLQQAVGPVAFVSLRGGDVGGGVQGPAPVGRISV